MFDAEFAEKRSHLIERHPHTVPGLPAVDSDEEQLFIVKSEGTARVTGRGISMPVGTPPTRCTKRDEFRFDFTVPDKSQVPAESLLNTLPFFRGERDFQCARCGFHNFVRPIACHPRFNRKHNPIGWDDTVAARVHVRNNKSTRVFSGQAEVEFV